MEPDPFAPRPDDLVLALDPETDIPTRIGSWNPKEDPTAGAAVRAFGKQYAIELDAQIPEMCTYLWGKLGLIVEFVNLGGQDPCGLRTGYAQTVTITDETERWRTLSGLRLGMPEDKIPEIYPDATKDDQGRWWIVTGWSPIGDGGKYPALAALVAHGLVDGFELVVGAGGD